MKTNSSLLLASAFSAIALFSLIPAHAQDANQAQQDAGKKDAKECQDGDSCGNGQCHWSDKKDASEKSNAQESQPAKPAASVAPSTGNQ